MVKYKRKPKAVVLDVDEIWKDIPDIKGYMVSNIGRIKSFRRYSQGKILKSCLSSGNM